MGALDLQVCHEHSEAITSQTHNTTRTNGQYITDAHTHFHSVLMRH